jgi:hypothetical protein
MERETGGDVEGEIEVDAAVEVDAAGATGEAGEADVAGEASDVAEDSGGRRENPEWPEKYKNAMSRVKRERAEIRAQRDALRREIDELKGRLEKGSGGSDAPKEEQFDNYTDFLLAQAEFKAEQVFNKRESEKQGEHIKGLENRQDMLFYQERLPVFDESMNALKASVPDFQQVEAYAEPIVAAYPDSLKRAILAVDNAPRALYVLAKEGRLDSLPHMPVEMAIAEVVQAQYRQPPAGQASETPRKVSSAPAPLKSVAGTGRQTKALHEQSADEIHARFSS